MSRIKRVVPDEGCNFYTPPESWIAAWAGANLSGYKLEDSATGGNIEQQANWGDLDLWRSWWPASSHGLNRRSQPDAYLMGEHGKRKTAPLKLFANFGPRFASAVISFIPPLTRSQDLPSMIPAACQAVFADPLPALAQKSSPAQDEFRNLRRHILGELLRHMPTSGHNVEVEVDAAREEMIVSGVVSTFHAKQTVYRLCKRLATRLDVVDEVVVDDVPPPCWMKVASARR